MATIERFGLNGCSDPLTHEGARPWLAVRSVASLEDGVVGVRGRLPEVTVLELVEAQVSRRR